MNPNIKEFTDIREGPNSNYSLMAFRSLFECDTACRIALRYLTSVKFL